MDKLVMEKVTKLIEENMSDVKVKNIQGNLFLLDYKDKVELTSIWYRDRNCSFFGINNKYICSSEYTFIVNEEEEDGIYIDKVYKIPSSFLFELGMTQDLGRNRSVPNIIQDKIYLTENINNHDISRYRIV